MSDVVHLEHLDDQIWCPTGQLGVKTSTSDIAKATCLACLLACAEYGSEARHRREVLIEAGAKP